MDCKYCKEKNVTDQHFDNNKRCKKRGLQRTKIRLEDNIEVDVVESKNILNETINIIVGSVTGDCHVGV